VGLGTNLLMQQTEYNKFKDLVTKITKGDERADDLLHDILIQLSNNQKYKSLTTKEQKYYFIRAVQNQFYSNNSAFNSKYKKYKFDEIPNTYEQIDEPYQEQPTIDWIKETLNDELKNNPEFWYKKGIFELYMEHKKIETLHKKTHIPKYSLRITLDEIKKWLKIKWEQYGKD
jgi:hypothetical protein